MLSNTATPKYYGKFRADVLAGLPVCQEIIMEMHRIDTLIANPLYYYDDEAIDGFIKYCENECTLTDGSDLELLESFKLWAESIFGWFYFIESQVYVPHPNGHGGQYIKKIVKKRLINKQYLIVARGAAKSMYGSCIQSFFLNIDHTTTHQITTAPTMKQAEEVLSPIRTAIARARGPVFKFLTDGSLQNTTGDKSKRVKLASTKKGIENFITGSIIEIRPMAITKLQGLRTKVATVDEWLSTDIREDVIGAIEQGASKLEDYIIVAMSSEGTIRNNAGDSIKMELLSILRGEYDAKNVSIWYYRLDDIQEVGDPSMWIKCNPNLGITVSYDVYHRDVERMESVPSSKNDILAKRFGIPMEGFTYYFTYEETLPVNFNPNTGIMGPPCLDFRGLPCAMGADLSRGDDFCAFTFLFPNRPWMGMFGIKARCYITSYTFAKLPTALKVKYEEFKAEGSLIVMEGAILDMVIVYDDLEKYIDGMEYNVLAMGYDPYNAMEFVKAWEYSNGPRGIVKVPQGTKTETVPLGEIKNLTEQRALQFDEAITMFCMGNAVTLEDTNGGRKLAKMRTDQKIDVVSGLIDGLVAYKAYKDLFD